MPHVLAETLKILLPEFSPTIFFIHWFGAFAFRIPKRTVVSRKILPSPMPVDTKWEGTDRLVDSCSIDLRSSSILFFSSAVFVLRFLGKIVDPIWPTSTIYLN